MRKGTRKERGPQGNVGRNDLDDQEGKKWRRVGGGPEVLWEARKGRPPGPSGTEKARMSLRARA